MLTHFVNEAQTDWDKELSKLAFAYNTSVHTTTKFSSYELLFGGRPKIPLDLVYGESEMPYSVNLNYSEFADSFKNQLKSMYECVKKNRDVAVSKAALNNQRNLRGCDFKPGDRVWMLDSAPQKGLNQKLRPQWKGPYTVVDKTSEVNVLLKPDGPKKKSFVCHMSRLKRCFGKPLPKFDEERRNRRKRRGRPAKEVVDSIPTLLKDNKKPVDSGPGKLSQSTSKQPISSVLNMGKLPSKTNNDRGILSQNSAKVNVNESISKKN